MDQYQSLYAVSINRSLLSLFLAFLIIHSPQAFARFTEGAYSQEADRQSSSNNNGRGLYVDLNGSDFGQFGRREQNRGRETNIRSSSRAGTFGSEAVYIDNTSVLREANPSYYESRDARFEERRRQTAERVARRRQERRDDRRERRQRERRSNESRLALIGGLLADGARSVASSAVTTAKRYGHVVAERAAPHVSAFKTGYEEAVNATRAQGLDLTDPKAQQEYERHFYKGVANSYEEQGRDPASQFLPAGPVQALVRDLHYQNTGLGQETIADENKIWLAAVDRAYRQGRIDISMPGRTSVLSQEELEALDPTERFGYENSLVFIGSNAAVEEIALASGGYEYHGVSTAILQDYFLGGMSHIVPQYDVHGNVLEDDFTDTLHHEMKHAGDRAVTNHIWQAHPDGNVPEELHSVLAWTQTEGRTIEHPYHFSEETLAKIQEIAPDVLTSAQNERVADDYLVQIMEVRGHLSEPGADSGDFYAQRFADANNISLEEGREIVRLLKEDPYLQEGEELVNWYVENRTKED